LQQKIKNSGRKSAPHTYTHSIFIYNLKTEHGTPQIVSQVMKKQINNNETKNAQVFATYQERMQINKSALVGNLSKLFKDCTNGTILPAACIKKEDFAEFRAYMVARHKLQDGESPRRGWSVWYALQFCESKVKAAAANGDKSAQNYLRQERARMQEQANKLF